MTDDTERAVHADLYADGTLVEQLIIKEGDDFETYLRGGNYRLEIIEIQSVDTEEAR